MDKSKFGLPGFFGCPNRKKSDDGNMKKILFVINTLSRAGAETALMELFRRLEKISSETSDGQAESMDKNLPQSGYQPGESLEVHLFVLTGIGEMQEEVPVSVKLKNKDLKNVSVLTGEGRKQLEKVILHALFARGQVIRQFPYLVRNLCAMLHRKNILPDKLLWRVLAAGADSIREEYDLAVAYLEGGSTYYVAERVTAKHKAAFVHVDYQKAGYTRALDKNCYAKMDKIYCVSQEVRDSFNCVYPEYQNKTAVFENLLGKERILQKAGEPGGYTDSFSGSRILTIGRLTKQKALEISIDAMKLLKDRNISAKWYVLGDGDQREVLEKYIAKLGLEEDFVLLGKTDNPYPYLVQSDIYVHASRFEGKSIAIQEAQVLGKPILVSDCEGNREQVQNGVDGVMCELTPAAIADSIQDMLENPEKCRTYGANAAAKMKKDTEEMERIQGLLRMII